MPVYEFTVRILGAGGTLEEAWDAILDEGMLYFPDGDYRMPSPEEVRVVLTDGEDE